MKNLFHSHYVALFSIAKVKYRVNSHLPATSPTYIMSFMHCTMHSRPCVCHCFWGNHARAHWARKGFFLSRHAANPKFQIPILCSTVKACLTLHNLETSTSNTSLESSQMRMFTPYSGNGHGIMATGSVHVQSYKRILLINFNIEFT